MANPDLLSMDVRKGIIEEIKNEENEDRKKEGLRRFEIYHNRQERYILDRLHSEFSEKTVSEMRKILSINISQRCINQSASIYQKEPERVFENLSDSEVEALDAHYEASRVNVQLKLANRYFKLFEQTLLQVIPKGGKIAVKPLAPHWYDAIPDEHDPEKAFCIIINILDKHKFLQNTSSTTDNRFGTGGSNLHRRSASDGLNQTIGDGDDYKAALERYVVWTDDLHFMMDGKGNILSEETDNPIGVLPFIDVAGEKDFEYFIRRGATVTDFAIDFGVQLSDHSNILRLQGYSQAIISATKMPDNVVIGPNHVLFLQQDKNSEHKPTFEFATPNPDLAASIDTLKMLLRLFLTAKGQDPGSISGEADGQKFTSGLDHLLAMIEKFEASRDDLDIFKDVEQQLKELFIKWNNVLQDADDPKIALKDELRNGQISEDCKVDVGFVEPGIVQTKSEVEDSAIKLKKERLITHLEAIKMVNNLESDEAAQKIKDEISKDSEIELPSFSFPGQAVVNGSTQDEG